MKNKKEYDFIDFMDLIPQIEPYIIDFSKVPESVLKYLRDNPDDKKILMEKFGTGIWLVRAVLVQMGKHREILEKSKGILPTEWMKEAYRDIFETIKESLGSVDKKSLEGVV